MVEEITFSTLLELPRDVLKKSREYDEEATLLTKMQYMSYDCKELKVILNQYVAHYKELIYLYQLPMNFSTSLVISYDKEKVSPTNRISNPVSDIVTKKVDEQSKILQWLVDFYYTMLVAASKLTLQEATYFVECIYRKKSEEAVCERLGICRNTLQKIKNSCLVKVYIELKALKLPKDV